MTTAEFQAELDGRATGTTVVGLRQPELLKCKISLPSLPTQQKIASILSSLDDKIEINCRINEQLEELAQALFKSWFVDFEPFKDGDFVESELGMIPEGWKVVSLGELMKYSGGSQPPASEFIEEYKEGYIRFIQIRDYASESHITYIPISKKNKLCDVKDIMIARYGASLGRICYGLKGAYNVALAKVTPLKEYYREFLRCYLSSKEFYEGLNMKGNRAVQAGFNQGDIDSFMLPFPTNENIIMKYEAVSALLFEKRLHNQQEITHLTNLRDTLLPKLMSGEIDVNEVEL
jgi:type I restriction enzyme S subunit